jgi:hypothetical protein
MLDAGGLQTELKAEKEDSCCHGREISYISFGAFKNR